MSKHVVFREVDGTVVALNLNSGQYFTLNEVGSRIWVLLAEQDSRNSLIETVLNEYDVSRSQLEENLLDFLQDLIASDLVEEIEKA
ncbi:MAG: PqqD family protein [Anaerolineae bacterium]|nr:MAG: PqqD family protein [Anaerolineae bacterium]